MPNSRPRGRRRDLCLGGCRCRYAELVPAQDKTRPEKQMTGVEAGGVFENAFHSPSEKANEKRFQRRHLLRLLSFAFRVESCLEPEPTRHSGTDNHPDKDPSSFRGGGCWAWLRRRNGNGRSRESEDCSSGLTIPQR